MSDSCNPMDCSLPDSSVHGISQARILEWVAVSFSSGSSRPRDQICISALQADSLMLSQQGSPLSSTDKSKSTPELSCYRDREIGLPWCLSGKEPACQGRRPWSQPLVWEDPTCCGASKPLQHNIEPVLQSLGATEKPLPEQLHTN